MVRRFARSPVSGGTPVRHLTPSEARTEHPANAIWLAVAVLRLAMRQGAQQLALPVKEGKRA